MFYGSMTPNYLLTVSGLVILSNVNNFFLITPNTADKKLSTVTGKSTPTSSIWCGALSGSNQTLIIATIVEFLFCPLKLSET